MSHIHRHLASRILRKLEDIDPARIRPFIEYFVAGVQLRPLLFAGMLWQQKEAPAAHPDRLYLILVDETLTADEIGVTLWHELVHVLLKVGGIPDAYHDEEEIEARAKHLAARHPQITTIFSAIFPNVFAGRV